MIYYGLDNILNDDIIPYNLKNKVDIKKTENGLNILTWKNTDLWGIKIKNKEFVMYTKIRVFDDIPQKLIPYIVLDEKNFIYKNNNLICIRIGRYTLNIKDKIWILDVVFPRMLDPSWTEQNINEYTNGSTCIYPMWRYNYLDSNMIEFTMNKINRIEDHSIINIIRFLISEMSSINSVTGLLDARWGIEFLDGNNPMSWNSPTEIFAEWIKNKRPVKYGQCWIFAECLTTIFRFLGLPTRTIFAENSHINTSLNGGIDMMLDCESMKSSNNPNEEYYFRIDNISNNINSKANPIEDCILYNGEDSIWNIHYWNEIYIPDKNNNFSWYCIDSTPCVKTLEEPFKDNKILGPCKVSNIILGKDDPYDYKYLHSVVNSPFRMWSNECILIDETPTIIPVLKALIFPLYHDKSLGTKDVNINRIKNKLINVYTKVGLMSKENITNNYKMNYEMLDYDLYKNHPLIFKNKTIIINHHHNHHNIENDKIYYVQQICLDEFGKVVNSLVQNDILSNVKIINSNIKYDFLSILIVLGNEFWTQFISNNE